MKSVNLKSLVQAKDSLHQNVFEKFLNHYQIGIKSDEIEDIKTLITHLDQLNCKIEHLSDFYVGYKIPQIGKEFDLLRFGKNYVINVEIKSDSTEDKILKQLERNKYYLKFINTPIHCFTFVSNTGILYTHDDSRGLTVVTPDILIDKLDNQENEDPQDLDKLFNPSDYLVSPFNSTHKFLNGEYFLTGHQENIKKEVINIMNSQTGAQYISITGGAGTGKTLLTYDIAKSINDAGSNVTIIHCGQLNTGQEELKQKGFKIIQIKDFQTINFTITKVLIIDEAQRIYPYQLDYILDKVNHHNCLCIFSYDQMQTLAKNEESNNIPSRITAINSIVKFNLSEKIRTNKEIASFIRMLFDKTRSLKSEMQGNVTINYFNNHEDARNYAENLDVREWKTLRFTPSQYDKEYHDCYSIAFSQTSHQVIGQEFDNVAIMIDDLFSYDASGKLVYRGTAYYSPAKMLFQNITRTRRKLNVIIINNPELIERCSEIIQ